MTHWAKIRVERIRPGSELLRASVPRFEDVGTGGRVAFAGAWAQYSASATVGFYKDAWGRVHLRGAGQDGTPTSTIFTLPVGFRPPATAYFAIVANPTTGSIQTGETRVKSDGVVEATRYLNGGSGAVTWWSLDGISFRVD